MCPMVHYRAGVTSGQPTVCIAVNMWLVACNELYSWYVEGCGGGVNTLYWSGKYMEGCGGGVNTLYWSGKYMEGCGGGVNTLYWSGKYMEG